MVFAHDLVNQDDIVKITGNTIGHWDLYVVDFLARVATVYLFSALPNELYTFKVWPMDVNDPQLPTNHDSKFCST